MLLENISKVVKAMLQTTKIIFMQDTPVEQKIRIWNDSHFSVHLNYLSLISVSFILPPSFSSSPALDLERHHKVEYMCNMNISGWES